MTTQRVIGLVSTERGRFVCRDCQQEVEMVAIIDVRNVKARIWREAEPHICSPFKTVEVYVHPKPQDPRKQ